jgi:hypothetical protein
MLRSHAPRLVSLVLAALTSGADAQPVSSGTAVEVSAAVDESEPGRVYLSQSLAALEWARRYGGAAARSGAPAGLDLYRYLTELETIARGLERYLRPDGPTQGPVTPVEITGQFLLEGLRGPTPQPAAEPQP